MRRWLLIVTTAFAATAFWLIGTFLLSVQLPWLARFSMFIPGFITDHVLPYKTAALLFGRNSPETHVYTFVLVAVAFWWPIFSVIAWRIFKQAAPNNSFKPKPLRGSA